MPAVDWAGYWEDSQICGTLTQVYGWSSLAGTEAVFDVYLKEELSAYAVRERKDKNPHQSQAPETLPPSPTHCMHVKERPHHKASK